MSTNILINSRSMNGIITISDGSATLENGDLTCDDINSSTINSGIFTCQGEFRCNLVGLYTIPTLVSSDYGLLISYGNTSGNGATDFTNYQSTYNITKGGFNFWNKSSTQTLTNLAIIDNSQTYFKSQLTGCTAETPLNTTSIVNKSYVDSNFVYKTGSVAENINGLKTFQNNVEIFNLNQPSLILRTLSGANNNSVIQQNGLSLYFNNLNPTSGTILFAISNNTRLTINTTQLLLSSTVFLTTNDMKSRAPTAAHTLLSDITTGTLIISSSTASNTINGATTFPNNITSNGTLTASIIECGNYRGPFSTGDVFFGTTTTTGQVRLATALNTLGTLLIGSSVGNNTINGTNQINGLTTFTNNATFDSNTRFNSSILLYSGTNQSTIEQFVTNLYITNLFNAGSIYLRTKSLISGTEDSLIINTTSCDILSPTLNLTSVGTISILSPNNLTGTINLFNTLTTGSVNISSSTSTTNLNGSVITNGQLTFNSFTPICSVASPTANNHLVRKDYVDGNFVDKTNTQTGIAGDKTFTGRLYNTFIIFAKDLSWLDAQGSGGRVQAYLSATNLGFISVNVNNNSYTFYTKDGAGTQTNPLIIDSTNTTIANNLISNGQLTCNNFTPISNVATPTAVNHLTRKDYVDNNFLDRTNNLTQNINGLKTFTDDLTTLNIYCNNAVYFRDINLSLKRALIFNQSDVVYFDTSTVYDNYWKFKCFNIEQVVISQLSSTFNNKLISLAQARFDNFTPTCTVSSPTQINHLTRKDYVDNNFVDKTSAQTGIAGDKTFTGVITISNNLISNNLTASVLNGTQNIYTTLTSGSIVNIASSSAITNLNSSTVNLTSSTTINILTPNNLTGVINFLSSLTTATINFCSTTYTSIFNLNARLAHKQVQYMNEVKTISGTSIALVFPLEQTWMFSATGATQITVTLPELTASYQAGFNFIIFKTASNTNSVLFTRSGTNTIRGLNSITDVTSVNRLSGTNSVGVGFYTAEVSTGNFAWISY